LLGADLERANLRGADLWRADLQFTSIISFTAGRHFAFYHEGYLKIGCEGHSLDHWVENFEKIGKAEDYPKHTIVEYGILIRTVAEIVNSRRLK
jgi:hypothetical protein